MISLVFWSITMIVSLKYGWVPLVIALIAFVVLVAWRKGREIVSANRSREEGPLRDAATASPA